MELVSVSFELDIRRGLESASRATQRTTRFSNIGGAKTIIRQDTNSQVPVRLTFPNRKRAWAVSTHSWREWNYPPSMMTCAISKE